MAQTPKSKSDAERKISAMAEKSGDTVPAAWPSGMGQSTQAYAACRRCVADCACADWLDRAPGSIELPPAFCPHAAELIHAPQKKPRR